MSSCTTPPSCCDVAWDDTPTTHYTKTSSFSIEIFPRMRMKQCVSSVRPVPKIRPIFDPLSIVGDVAWDATPTFCYIYTHLNASLDGIRGWGYTVSILWRDLVSSRILRAMIWPAHWAFTNADSICSFWRYFTVWACAVCYWGCR